MINHEKYTALLQWHAALKAFDYNPVIDWAIECLKRGMEKEELLILASFSKPVDSYEISPYVSDALQALGLEEKYGKYSTIANAHYHLSSIIANDEIRVNLSALYKLCLVVEHEFGLDPFYRLYYAWSNLEEFGDNYYYEGATLTNIEALLKTEASHWMAEYVIPKNTNKPDQKQS